MSRVRYVSDLKLCLEALSRFEIYPDLAQLEHFLADEKHIELLNEVVVQIKTAWESFSLSNAEIPPETILAPSFNFAISAPVSLEKHITEPLDAKESQELSETPPESEAVNPIQQPPQKPLIRFKLPNATIAKAYQGQLEWLTEKKITIISINGLEELGLVYDPALNSISGEPTQAGEHTLTISYQQEDDATQTLQFADLSLVINNDPKSLWKNTPSDTDVVFWKADSDCQGQEGLYGWKIAAASARGRSHAHVGSCRDDDFALKVDHENLWQIVAVADGAGSSEFSREGARIVAHNSIEILSQQLNQSPPLLEALIENWQQDKNLDHEIELHQELVAIFKTALASSINAIESLAQQQQVAYRDFYSTLLIAAHKTLPYGEFVACYWIGDGGLGLYSADQEIQLLGDGDSGEYAGQTRFLDKNALDIDDLSKRVRFSLTKSFTALVLMTDGITDPLFETDNNLRDLKYWQALWQQLQPHLSDSPELTAQNLITWLDFWSPGNHDDRTIALIYR
jgi:serine/threonine protein phosphatase PrpC